MEIIEETRSLSPVMLQKNILLAPTTILQMIKCACESFISCATARCRCKSGLLSCTIVCAYQGCVVSLDKFAMMSKPIKYNDTQSLAD